MDENARPAQPADPVRISAVHGAIGVNGVQALVHGQQVGEVLMQDAEEVVALLVRQGQSAGEHELAAARFWQLVRVVVKLS